MASLVLYLFGRPRLHRDNQLLDLNSKKGLALLAVLAADPGRWHSRDRLAALIWPDYDQVRARTNLRRMLYRLGQTPLGDWLEAEPEQVLLRPCGADWVDVIRFVEQYGRASAHEHEASESCAGCLERLQEAAALYRGDFLSGFYLPDSAPFAEWATATAARFQRQALAALQTLASSALAAREWGEAEQLARRQLEIDNLREEAWRQLLVALAQSGQRNRALAEYHALAQLLAGELDVAPTAETAELYQEILEGAFLPAPAPSPARSEEKADAPPPASPYRGLYAFREEDAPFFFGREEVTDRLVQAVGRSPLVALIGPSGSGKSSVVYAGLLAQLRREGGWLVGDFRPGSRPFQALAGGLIKLLEPELRETERMVESRKLAEALANSSLALVDVAERLAQKQQERDPDGARPRLLLIADQFEELYTLCPQRELRLRFLDLLLQTVCQPLPSGPLLTLVITLRADFLGQALAHRSLADALETSDVKLGPMTRRELQRAVVKPAQLQGVSFEPGLVVRILDDVAEEPGHLPLLAFALAALWEEQEAARLTHAGYEAIGRVDGALAGHAEKVYALLTAGEQLLARRIFIQMVRPGEGTEDTRRLATRPELGEEAWQVVQRLADARLVVTGRDLAGQETVEVVHEALIEGWSRLRGWMDEDRAFRLWQERLRAGLQSWEASGQDEGSLLRGVALATARQWLAERPAELTQAERDFIEAGIQLQRVRQAEAERRQAERERLRRRIVQTLAAGLVGALLLALLAFVQWRQANAARRDAEEQVSLTRSRELAQTALNTVSVDPELSVLLALRAVDEAQTLEAIDALHQTIPALHLRQRFQRADGPYFDVAVSPDGRRVAATGIGPEIQLWDIVEGRLLHTLTGEGSASLALAFSPDGRYLARANFGREESTVTIWDSGSGQPLTTWPVHPNGMDALAFSPDGRRLVTGARDATAKIWDLTPLAADSTGEDLPVPRLLATLVGHEDVQATYSPTRGIFDVAFHADGGMVATAGTDETARLWDAATGEELLVLGGHRGEIVSLAFSPDGARLVTAGADGLARVWTVRAGEAMGDLQLMLNHDGGIYAVAYSGDGRYIATGGADGVLKLWDGASGEQLLTLSGHKDWIYGLAFGPDSSWLASTGEDGTVRIWDISPSHELFALQGPGRISWDAAYSPDGNYLASAADGAIVLWERDGDEHWRESRLLTGHEAPITQLAFNPNGTRLASASRGETVRVWAIPGGELLHTLPGHAKEAWGLAFSPDGSHLATGDLEGNVRLWDVASGEKLRMWKQSDLAVIGVDFSPDGSLLAATGWSGLVTIWDVTSGEVTETLSLDGRQRRVAFSPEGSHLVIAGAEGRTTVWDLSDPAGENLLTLPGHGAQVSGLAFNPDGSLVATAGFDGKITLWQWPTGREAMIISSNSGAIADIAFSPDGRQLVAAGMDGSIQGYLLSLDELVTLAHARLTRWWLPEECQLYLRREACPPAPEGMP